MKLLKQVRAVAFNDSGATAIEYGLIAALVAAGIISALQVIGFELDKTLMTVVTALSSQEPPSAD